MRRAAEVAPADHLRTREGRALGSRLRLVLAGAGDVDAAWDVVVLQFSAVDAAMSRFRADSELTRLNRADGASGRVSRLLASALVTADRARRSTDGRFDPRMVGHLERLGFAAVSQGAPRRHDPAEPVLRRSGRDGTIRLSGPVDLGGIGKGLALRRAARALEARLPHAEFLIDAGGDIVTGGGSGGGGSGGRSGADTPARTWPIGIEDPTGGAEPLAVIEIRGRFAVATSSTRIGRSQDGRVHHLVDPATGEPGGEGLRAVTVAFRDPAWAEVWSKALFLQGAAAIAAAARRRGLAAWWVDVDGELSMTPAARQLTTWVRSEALSLSPP